MAGPMDTLNDRLARYREIRISVIGRKSGETVMRCYPVSTRINHVAKQRRGVLPAC
ncbi:MAG: hypothetical protein ACLPLR_01835 [Terriglobales bacterium]